MKNEGKRKTKNELLSKQCLFNKKTRLETEKMKNDFCVHAIVFQLARMIFPINR